MDAAQAALFGAFPRRVGTPNQFWVFSEAQFDRFTDTIDGVRNAYTTAQRVHLNGQVEADKVFFDFDGDKEAFPDGATAAERVALMRNDPDLADTVLGEAVDDARRLAERSLHDGVPVLGVFSGFGIHVHQLYQPTTEGVVTKMASTARRYIDMLGLETADDAVIDNGQRICRVPNVERATTPGPRGDVQDGCGTGLWTIPLMPEHLDQMTVESLMAWSQSPMGLRSFTADDRPEMGVFADYTDPVKGEDGFREADPVESHDVDVDGLRFTLERLVRLPCMVDRLLQPNPSQAVRFNGAVLLFNAGLTRQEVFDIFRRCGWTDWDPSTTKYHLNHIYRKGYADMSCSSLRRDGYCVVDEPTECPCYGWAGGKVAYP